MTLELDVMIHFAIKSTMWEINLGTISSGKIRKCTMLTFMASKFVSWVYIILYMVMRCYTYGLAKQSWLHEFFTVDISENFDSEQFQGC